jgi:hypothetical protein
MYCGRRTLLKFAFHTSGTRSPSTSHVRVDSNGGEDVYTRVPIHVRWPHKLPSCIVPTAIAVFREFRAQAEPKHGKDGVTNNMQRHTMRSACLSSNEPHFLSPKNASSFLDGYVSLMFTSLQGNSRMPTAESRARAITDGWEISYRYVAHGLLDE